ncbi:hypothetical protein DP113_34480 (plasmid) [Brasilonema octagenarum UFV-E1]|uniref:Uncharacterized protein n=2 Tax=Brasilonema TaxID=383614 RepID=A0A856MQK9_9CYAN|nr:MULTISPECIES: hypothetical protein [Brasilonema]NMF63250.1 hypothetical protein [Brasilonema octagenarum UFV-OR1]QDL12822.1 hypothetical protein DP114_34375 [Brasilonema sennae CENA114]QDL19218.1 hypothetical protein DP113_34480 [Brasilonema octagenarum UFV-E1]
MKLDKLLSWIEKIVVWFLIGMLCFVGLGSLPVNPTSFFDFAASLYYLLAAVVVCPKTPLSFNKRLVFGFIAFFYGVWVGLI